MTQQKSETVNTNLNDSKTTEQVKAWLRVCLLQNDVKIMASKVNILYNMSSKLFNLSNVGAYKVEIAHNESVLLANSTPIYIPRIDVQWMRGKIDSSALVFQVALSKKVKSKLVVAQTINGIVLSQHRNINSSRTPGYMIPLLF